MTAALRRADQDIRLWAGHFKTERHDYYPRADGRKAGSIAGFCAALTELDPGDWQVVACEWPIAQALMFIEQRRVHRTFEELKRDRHGR